MARYIGPVCKLCRREGMKLYLKADRCYSEKCAVTRRPKPPCSASKFCRAWSSASTSTAGDSSPAVAA